jgi:catechol 2,3-dioxygenase-like lactoylglutathione lyase family enzyme
MSTERPKVLTTTALFVVSDLQRAIDFYCEKLGFGEPGVWGEPPCFGMINRDGFDLMLSLAGAPDRVRPNGPDGVWDLYIRVADVEAEAAALRAAGVELAREPERTVYDMVEIEVVDPDGYRVCFGQDVAGN